MISNTSQKVINGEVIDAMRDAFIHWRDAAAAIEWIIIADDIDRFKALVPSVITPNMYGMIFNRRVPCRDNVRLIDIIAKSPNAHWYIAAMYASTLQGGFMNEVERRAVLAVINGDSRTVGFLTSYESHRGRLYVPLMMTVAATYHRDRMINDIRSCGHHDAYICPIADMIIDAHVPPDDELIDKCFYVDRTGSGDYYGKDSSTHQTIGKALASYGIDAVHLTMALAVVGKEELLRTYQPTKTNVHDWIHITMSRGRGKYRSRLLMGILTFIRAGVAVDGDSMVAIMREAEWASAVVTLPILPAGIKGVPLKYMAPTRLWSQECLSGMASKDGLVSVYDLQEMVKRRAMPIPKVGDSLSDVVIIADGGD